MGGGVLDTSRLSQKHLLSLGIREIWGRKIGPTLVGRAEWRKQTEQDLKMEDRGIEEPRLTRGFRFQPGGGRSHTSMGSLGEAEVLAVHLGKVKDEENTRVC